MKKMGEITVDRKLIEDLDLLRDWIRDVIREYCWNGTSPPPLLVEFARLHRAKADEKKR